MFQKKKAAVDDQPISVNLEPRPGHTVEEILDSLADQPSVEARILSPGFVSARICPSLTSGLEEIAVIHPKATKRPH